MQPEPITDVLGCRCAAHVFALFRQLPMGLGRLGEPCPYCHLVRAIVPGCGTCKGRGIVRVPAEQRASAEVSR